MWPRRQRIPATQRRAESTIAASLDGGDTTPAWNAVWDLVHNGDIQAKREMLTALEDYVDAAVIGESAAQAIEFEQAIEQSLDQEQRQVLASHEVREQHKRAQIDAQRDVMRKMGVSPGEGLPMWAIYMTRRSKRSWQ